jgi:hypothetical protein
MIALEAGIPEGGQLAPRPEFLMFANAAEKTLELLASKLRGRRVVEREFPDLREAHLKLAQAGDPKVSAYELVNVEADRMANSLNTLRDQVFTWQRETSPERSAKRKD